MLILLYSHRLFSHFSASIRFSNASSFCTLRHYFSGHILLFLFLLPSPKPRRLFLAALVTNALATSSEADPSKEEDDLLSVQRQYAELKLHPISTGVLIFDLDIEWWSSSLSFRCCQVRERPSPPPNPPLVLNSYFIGISILFVKYIDLEAVAALLGLAIFWVTFWGAGSTPPLGLAQPQAPHKVNC
jgi:hypothetical protein